jgi:hypothetical protein
VERDDLQLVRNAARTTAAAASIFYEALRAEQLPEALCVAIVTNMFADQLSEERARQQMKQAESLISSLAALYKEDSD